MKQEQIYKQPIKSNDKRVGTEQLLRPAYYVYSDASFRIVINFLWAKSQFKFSFLHVSRQYAFTRNS